MSFHGQMPLTDHEKRRLPLGNQYTDDFSIMEWQIIKASAFHYEVPDWTSHVDTSLTYEENVARMKKRGFSYDAGPSMKFAPVLNLEARPR